MSNTRERPRNTNGWSNGGLPSAHHRTVDKEHIAGAFRFCAAAFGVIEEVERSRIPLLGETVPSVRKKHDADYVFYELTRNICPDCRRVIDAHILLRENKV